MYPKPLYARPRDHFAVKGEVYPPPFPHIPSSEMVRVDFQWKLIGFEKPDIPEGDSPERSEGEPIARIPLTAKFVKKQGRPGVGMQLGKLPFCH